MRPSETMYFAISGDLTRTGGPNEFVAVDRYLHTAPASPLTIATLGLPIESVFKVPGNHDHWNGFAALPPPAYNPRIFPDHFPPHPWRSRPLFSERRKIALELFGVDSNSGMVDEKRNADARGRISRAEFDQLKADLNESLRMAARMNSFFVRAIILHHSLSRNFKPIWDALTGPLEDSSIEELLDVAREHRVAVILNGHTHVHRDKPYTNHGVRELRGPTAFQGKARALKQGFLVHQIRWDEASGRKCWRWNLYLFSGGRFQRQKDIQSFFVD